MILAVVLAAALMEAPERRDMTLLNDATALPLIPPDIKKPGKGRGWMRQSASLLYFDELGNIVSEIPLRTEEEPSGSKIIVHEMLGDSAPNARFAWTLERTTTWNEGRSKELASRRLLRVYGSGGKELWRDAEADLPENGKPVVFSADGETMLVTQRSPKGWTASVRTYMGSTLFDVGPVPRLQLTTLTTNGKYAMVRWMVPDQSATHTFVEVPTKTRQDIPSSELRLGLAKITEDGKVLSGKRFVFDFAAVPKKGQPDGLRASGARLVHGHLPRAAPLGTGPPVTAAALLLLLVSAAPAQFGDDPPPTNAEAIADQEQDALARDMELRLRAEPEFADALAMRIMRSRLVTGITLNTDAEQGFKDVREWIDKNRGTAAQIGVGLARDDAEGSSAFEDMMVGKVRKTLQANPNAKHGIFGRLHQSGKDSKLMKGQTEDMSDEEQREILKSMFEGQGSQSGQVATQKDPAKQQQPGSAGAAGLKGGYYDRLSQGNLRGYSPQLQAMQSALNARRPPGAPKLIETGKLDFLTLSYPAYGMRFDFTGLERRLAYEKSYALARLLGLEGKHSAEQLADARTLAELEAKAKAAGKEPKGRFSRRRAVLDRAAAAIRAFEEAAAAAKDPSKISRALLISLGEHQREAARWITIASLEEELDRLDMAAGFLSPELTEAVHSCPVEEATRLAYLNRGERFDAALHELRAGDEAAIAALQAADWLSSLDRVDRILMRNGALRRDLLRNIDDYRMTAFRFAESAEKRPTWRQIVDRYAERFLPRSAYSRRLASARRRKDVLRDVFVKIAQGNLDAAHAVLAQLP